MLTGIGIALIVLFLLAVLAPKMATSENNKICMTGGFRQIEGVAKASESIYPGMFVEAHSTLGEFKKQATSVGFGEVIWVQEDALQGKTKSDVYADADPLTLYIPQRGAVGLAMLKAGSNYTTGTQLFFGGDGTLRATTGTPKQLVAVVIDPLDLSASGAVAALSKVRIA